MDEKLDPNIYYRYYRYHRYYRTGGQGRAGQGRAGHDMKQFTQTRQN